MQTTTINSYSPDYRRRYKTTTSNCECPANVHGKAVCKHIRLERYRQTIERQIRQAIIYAKKRGDGRSAQNIRLSVLQGERGNQTYALIEEKRTELQCNVDWLKSQVAALERRAAMLRRHPRPKTHWCRHKRTRETGVRQKEVHCLDCNSHLRTYYPMST